MQFVVVNILFLFITIVTGTQRNEEGSPQGVVHRPNGGSLLQWEQVGGAAVSFASTPCNGKACFHLCSELQPCSSYL